MTADTDLEHVARLERRLARERAARQQAETTLESKILELHEANRSLRELAGDLERTVDERTSQLVEALVRAEAANGAKSSFLAVMRHEIRTPMIGVLGMAELLSMTDLTANQAEQVATNRSSGDILLTLINEILDFSEIEAARLDLDSVDFSLRAELADIVAAYRNLAIDRGVEFVVEFVDEIDVSAGDLV